MEARALRTALHMCVCLNCSQRSGSVFSAAILGSHARAGLALLSETGMIHIGSSAVFRVVFRFTSQKI